MEACKYFLKASTFEMEVYRSELKVEDNCSKVAMFYPFKVHNLSQRYPN